MSEPEQARSVSAAPPIAGIHHLKLPVSDLDASLAWYGRVLGAEHAEVFDHVDHDGRRYAAILRVPGVDLPLELRWAPVAAARMTGYDPISFGVADVADFDVWARHLDDQGVDHSPVSRGIAGHIMVFADPDGTFLRLLELPQGGVENTPHGQGDPEPEGPWIAPPSMSHPRVGTTS